QCCWPCCSLGSHGRGIAASEPSSPFFPAWRSRSRRHRTRSWLMRILVLLSLVPYLWAQGNFGSITGVVVDQSGAAVPNAAVRATNLATGLTLSTQTTNAGNYLIPQVPNGEYSLTVMAPSFKGFRQQPVIVSTATTTAVNVQLEIGAVTENVTVQET